MKKLLISFFLTIFFISIYGCSSWGDFSLVHKPDIQQGNIVTPEMVAELETGMTKRQVLFVLGTPTLIDVFHQDRWEYPFSMKKRNQAIEIKQFTVYFEGNRLVSYQGDIKPAENLEETVDKDEIIVDVPDYEGDLGIIDRSLKVIGVDIEED